MQSKIISIHAPARGATATPAPNDYMELGFQSTLPRGERHNWRIDRQVKRNFNPRSREGSDLFMRGLRNAGGNFNPRSREGSDGKNRQIRSKSSYRFCPFLPYKAIYHLFYPIQAQMYRKFSGISGASPPGFLCVPTVRTGNFYRNKGAFMSTLSFTPMCSTLFL